MNGKTGQVIDAASSPPAAAHPKPVKTFSELSRRDVPWAGGKGANLGELTRTGLPVPPGFVVGAGAYAEVCSHGLRERIATVLEALDVDDPRTLGDAAHAIQELVRQAPVPAELQAAIAAAMAELGDVAVAVRSSATAEDTETASFAGMNETFLNVHGTDDVIAAVRNCWASLFGARTILAMSAIEAVTNPTSTAPSGPRVSEAKSRIGISM